MNLLIKRNIDVSDSTGHFSVIVHAAFAEVYQQLGIDWEHSIVQEDGNFFEIERVSELKSAADAGFSLEEAQVLSAEITRKVERKLGFPSLFLQVRNNLSFNQVRRLSLVSVVDENLDDFYVQNDHVIYCGISKWFVAAFDASGKWMTTLLAECVPVSLESGDFYFAPFNFAERVADAESVLHMSSKWWLFDKENITELRSSSDEAVSELEEMYSNNLKIMTQKIEIPVPAIKDAR